MPIPLEQLKRRFEPETLVDVLSTYASPPVKLESLYAFGSLIDERFDRRGSGTSDIDLLGITKNSFDPPKVPRLTLEHYEDGLARLRGTNGGRKLHLFLISGNLAQQTLDRFVVAAEENSPQNREIYDGGLWDIVGRLYHGELVYGQPIQHPVINLFHQEAAPTAVRFLRRGGFNPNDVVDFTQRLFVAFS